MALFERGYARYQLSGQLTCFVAWLAITIIGICLTPNRSGHGTHQQLGLPPCPSVLLFDRPCPGCGLTTSFTATIHGHFAEAFHAHPLGPILYLGFTIVALISGFCFFKGVRFETSSRRLNLGLAAFAVIFFSFGVWRWYATPHYQFPGESTWLVRQSLPGR